VRASHAWDTAGHLSPRQDRKSIRRGRSFLTAPPLARAPPPAPSVAGVTTTTDPTADGKLPDVRTQVYVNHDGIFNRDKLSASDGFQCVVQFWAPGNCTYGA
jgi:hypothetical protein